MNGRSASTQAEGREKDRYLVPMLSRRQKLRYGIGVALWVVAIAFFWSWWLDPSHNVGTIRFVGVSLILAWITLLPLYFLAMFLPAKVPSPSLRLPAGRRVAMVVTKAPSEPFPVVRKTLEAMAINGEGYFVVTQAADVVDGSTTFADETFYTRAGDFERDQDGYLVNSAGYYLQGFPLDPTTGNAVGDDPSVIRIENQPLAASATTQVDYQANLPRIPDTNDYDGSTASTALLAAAVGAGDVAVANETDFLNSSISGGSITVYNQNGTAMNVEVRYAKTVNEDTSVPVNDTWTMYISSGGDATTAYYDVGDLEFDSTGALTNMDGDQCTAQQGRQPKQAHFLIHHRSLSEKAYRPVEVSFRLLQITTERYRFVLYRSNYDGTQ